VAAAGAYRFAFLVHKLRHLGYLKAQLADDPPTELLDHRGNVSIGGWLALDKARRESLVGTIGKHALAVDAVQKCR